jgi:hypothetical protein
VASASRRDTNRLVRLINAAELQLRTLPAGVCSGQLHAGVGGLVEQLVTQQQKALRRVLARVIRQDFP